MTHEEFNKLQLEIFDDILKMAKTKGIEYSSDKNERLANFKRLAAELEIPATKVGYIFFKKHLDSITTFLKDGRVYSEEGIRGRFVDAINYLTLIYGLIKDESCTNFHGVYTGVLGTITCKSCLQYIKPGEEYNYDASGYNHYQLCPIRTKEGEELNRNIDYKHADMKVYEWATDNLKEENQNELKPELILEKGIFTCKDVYTGKSIGHYPFCIYCCGMITLNDNYIKTSSYYAHQECYEKDLALIEKQKQAGGVTIKSSEVPFTVYETDTGSKPLSETFRTYETDMQTGFYSTRVRLECCLCFKKFKEAETAYYTPNRLLAHEKCLKDYNSSYPKQAKANETSATKETKTENK